MQRHSVLTEPLSGSPAGRTSTLLVATATSNGEQAKIIIRNISHLGALIECNLALDVGSGLSLLRDNQSVSATVIRVGEGTYGIRFDEPIDPMIWLGELQFSQTPEASSSLSDATLNESARTSILLSRLSEEVAYVERLLQNSAQSLAKDAVICLRYNAVLQDMDLGRQMLSELSVIVKATDMVNAVGSVATGPMRNRLLR